jgi:hypothetical protein
MAKLGLALASPGLRIGSTDGEMVLSPGEDSIYFRAHHIAADQPTVARAVQRITTTICYCSVLEDCWEAVGDLARPVNRCAEAGVFQPQTWE